MVGDGLSGSALFGAQFADAGRAALLLALVTACQSLAARLLAVHHVVRERMALQLA